MKKVLLILMISIFYLTGCSDYEDIKHDKEVNDSASTTEQQKEQNEQNEQSSNNNNNKKDTTKIEDYHIGDEILLGEIKFNIYKIDKNNKELYLLAQKNVKTTKFSDDEHMGYNANVYEGSLVEGYVNEFVDILEDKGYKISKSGIISEEEMRDLGCKDSNMVSGRPYLCEEAPEFINYENNYWLGGYYRVDTYTWAYHEKKIDTESCDDEYGVRPTITIKLSELNKKTNEVKTDLTIKDIVNSNDAWTSEGGIHNPYDKFYFDCENMLFINIFESSELNETNEYTMQFIDDKTIQISGFRPYYNISAKLTIVNENKLRLRFDDNKYNDGNYYLNKTKK